MPASHTSLLLPEYHTFIDSIAMLALPISGSELHGVMCGYLCAGATKNDPDLRRAALALFGVYAISQQQMGSFDFQFQLLLPDENDPLAERAQALSEWCEGFTQGITLAGIDYNQLQEEDAQEALQHLTEFAQLDYHALQIEEEDEHALMEVSEYARMAVLHIHVDLQASQLKKGPAETAH